MTREQIPLSIFCSAEIHTPLKIVQAIVHAVSKAYIMGSARLGLPKTASSNIKIFQIFGLFKTGRHSEGTYCCLTHFRSMFPFYVP